VSPFDVLRADFAAEVRTAAQVPAAAAPELAFAGRSNVGKSTLLNALCQRRGLARTSRTPGCTRGLVMFDLQFRNGAALRLVDLPGYGFAERSKAEKRGWGSLIEGYLAQRETLRGVLMLVDARRGPEAEELELAEFLQAVGVPFVLVATKIDKLSRSERGVALKAIAQKHRVRVLGVSGETGEGREELVRTMLRLLAPAPEAEAPAPEAPLAGPAPD
jgi:GTP-binding protein